MRGPGDFGCTVIDGFFKSVAWVEAVLFMKFGNSFFGIFDIFKAAKVVPFPIQSAPATPLIWLPYPR